MAAIDVYKRQVQRLAAVTEKLVPIMAGIFLLGGLVI